VQDNVLEHIANDQAILKHFGLTVESAQDGVCVIVSRVVPALVNSAGFAHGGLAYAMMDTACAYALRSLNLSGVTTNGNVHYVRGGGLDDVMRAQVDVVSRSRRLASLRGEVWVTPANANEPVLAAHGSYTFALRG